MSRAARLGLLVAASLCTASCGAIVALTGSAPADHRSRMKFSCVRSRVIPAVDLVPLGLFFMLEPGSDGPGLWYPTVLAVSATLGFVSTERCRDAQRELVARNALMSAISKGVIDSSPQPIPVVVEVVPDVRTVVAGATLQLNVDVRASSGALMEGVRVTWHSQTPRIASVDSRGLLTARAAGTVLIEARARGLTGSATITVVPQ